MKVWVDFDMRRCLVLLLITGTVWAQKLVLNDGKIIIENLSTEEKAIYDAKKDAKKWILYPPAAFSIFVS